MNALFLWNPATFIVMLKHLVLRLLPLPLAMAAVARVDASGEIRLTSHERHARAASAHGNWTGMSAWRDSRDYVPGMLVAEQPVVVVSSWLVMTLMGSHGIQDGSDKQQIRQLTSCVRTALAEALQVCRSSLHVTDMSVKEDDGSLVQILEDHWRPNWHRHHRFFQEEEGSSKAVQLMRRATAQGDAFQRMNFTRVKATYEVRIFPEMRVASKEVVQRIDRLQIFSRFADLNHVLVRSLIHRTHAKPAEGVMLDDVGYGRREVKPRQILPAAQLADCMEEGLLQDAREAHQYVIALCCVMVLFITCAGSAIFSLKNPSVVPSRTNPLLAR